MNNYFIYIFLPDLDYNRYIWSSFANNYNVCITWGYGKCNGFLARQVAKLLLRNNLIVYYGALIRHCIFNKYLCDTKNYMSNVLFIFNEYSPLAFNIEFHKYIKEVYASAKLVLSLSNPIISSKICDDVFFNYAKKNFDLIITFNSADAQKYNFTLYNKLVYTKNIIKNDFNISFSDVYFLGRAKDRLNLIILIYEELKAMGLKCDFNIIGVNKIDQKYKNDIKYNRPISYEENLIRVSKTCCILEVMSSEYNYNSLRTLEALVYNKKLLTTNVNIVNEDFYNSKFIKVKTPAVKLDKNFFCNRELVKHNISLEEIGPVNFLNFIVAHL